MTATLTRDFVYTDHVETGSSSVVSDLYYNEEDQSLVVVLHSDVKAGYTGVPRNVFSAFAAENNSFFGSVGSYWNKWIKNYFLGFDTNDIENFVSANDVPVLVNVSAADDEPQDTPDYGAPTAEEEDVDQALWTVGFLEDDGIDNELAVYADSLGEAVDVVTQIAKIAGWKNVQVVSVFKE